MTPFDELDRAIKRAEEVNEEFERNFMSDTLNKINRIVQITPKGIILKYLLDTELSPEKAWEVAEEIDKAIQRKYIYV